MKTLEEISKACNDKFHSLCDECLAKHLLTEKECELVNGAFMSLLSVQNYVKLYDSNTDNDGITSLTDVNGGKALFIPYNRREALFYYLTKVFNISITTDRYNTDGFCLRLPDTLKNFLSSTYKENRAMAFNMLKGVLNTYRTKYVTYDIASTVTKLLTISTSERKDSTIQVKSNVVYLWHNREKEYDETIDFWNYGHTDNNNRITTKYWAKMIRRVVENLLGLDFRYEDDYVKMEISGQWAQELMAYANGKKHNFANLLK